MSMLISIRFSLNAKRKQNHLALSQDSPEQYYRRVLFIPYKEELIYSLKERCATHKKTIQCLENILPSYADDKDLYLLNQHLLFTRKTQNTQARRFCGRSGKFTTATAERSFSIRKRLKTYLRNITGNDKLTGLALMGMQETFRR
ncbi:hypothetical protein PR048_014374 [Dryococelus australis]|uniref:HAT C-terminal dimerisation domain-containing protein n=1 Tax=Dryococelus australis TaxID=614101 RepID=A0ABQ9HET7_9NEOP|nr:hypothetical protein PR048_014374 [Dryococelus australis]